MALTSSGEWRDTPRSELKHGPDSNIKPPTGARIVAKVAPTRIDPEANKSNAKVRVRSHYDVGSQSLSALSPKHKKDDAFKVVVPRIDLPLDSNNNK